MKKQTQNSNWMVWAAFGDPRYKKAAIRNNKKSSGKKQNNHAGIIGRAGLIPETAKDPDRTKLYNKKK